MSVMAAETKAAPDHAGEADAAVVLNWRFRVLCQAGYSNDDAFEVARSGADLHVATRLLERGCPPETALAILL